MVAVVLVLGEGCVEGGGGGGGGVACGSSLECPFDWNFFGDGKRWIHFAKLSGWVGPLQEMCGR